MKTLFFILLTLASISAHSKCLFNGVYYENGESLGNYTCVKGEWVKNEE